MRRRHPPDGRQEGLHARALGWPGSGARRRASRRLARRARVGGAPRAMSTTMASPSLRAASATTTFVNALTIDVEDYFQVSAFAPHIDRGNWPAMECRIEQNVDRILAMLADANARATFFTLGWVAERYPALIQRIADCGHELASHG